MAKIYVASSWRNEFQPGVVSDLRMYGHDVYDFRNPKPGDTGFAWSAIDPNWQNWTTQEYLEALRHPAARAGYKNDFDAMVWADTFVLILPSGRSAHLELGWAVGKGKRSAIYNPVAVEPELMAKMVDLITDDLTGLIQWTLE